MTHDEPMPEGIEAGSDESVGWLLFWEAGPLAQAARLSDAAQRGWWKGHRRAYADGYHSAAIGDDRDNPHPQFSAAWEAWGDGHNEATAIFHA